MKQLTVAVVTFLLSLVERVLNSINPSFSNKSIRFFLVDVMDGLEDVLRHVKYGTKLNTRYYVVSAFKNFDKETILACIKKDLKELNKVVCVAVVACIVVVSCVSPTSVPVQSDVTTESQAVQLEAVEAVTEDGDTQTVYVHPTNADVYEEMTVDGLVVRVVNHGINR